MMLDEEFRIPMNPEIEDKQEFNNHFREWASHIGLYQSLDYNNRQKVRKKKEKMEDKLFGKLRHPWRYRINRLREKILGKLP